MLKDEKLIGACGIDCAKCNIYRSYTKKGVEWQRKISKDIFGDAMHKVNCDSCGRILDILWSPGCTMMQCAYEKGLLVCSQCPEFPCPDL